MFGRTPSGSATALKQKPDLFHSAALKKYNVLSIVRRDEDSFTQVNGWWGWGLLCLERVPFCKGD